MAARQRSELEFQVVYSIHLEKMMDTLLGRMDRLFSFLQLFLSVAVVTNLAPTVVGLLVAAIAAAQLVWQPGARSIEAKATHDRWLELWQRFGRESDDELEQKIVRLQETDSRILACLRLPAHVSSADQLGREINLDRKMPKWQKLIAFFAGGLPDSKSLQQAGVS